ncbi:MAG: glycosyltransferase family 2 protein, partial [Brevinema sp.]
MQKFTFDDCLEVLNQLPDSIKQQKLSIIMPFYNEEDLIVSSVNTVVKTLRSWKWNFEVIVSDDGSTDQSLQKLQQCANIPELKIISSPRNYGKGRALLTGFEIVEGEYILFLDADLELPVEHIPYFFRTLIDKQADVVIGSKKDLRSNITYPLFRKFFSVIYALVVKILFRLPITDTQTGIKLFKKNVLDNTLPYLLVKKFAFDIELLALIHHKRFKIVAHPIILIFVRDGAFGRISFDTILHMIKDTIAIVWRFMSGFWNISFPLPVKLKQAVIALDQNIICYEKDLYQINHLNQLPEIMTEISNYDIVIFLNKGDELPIFSKFAINRVFADPEIDILYPLVYLKSDNTKNSNNFFYYY